MIKVQNGTRKERHICLECENCTSTKGVVESKDRTYCSVMEQFTSMVSECSSFGERDGKEHRFRMFGGDAWNLMKDDLGEMFLVPPGLGYTRARNYMKLRGGAVKLPETGDPDE